MSKYSLSFLSMAIIFTGIARGNEIRRRFIVSDEGNNNIAYIDQYDTTNNWTFNVGKTSRSLQLIGENKLLVGTARGGYHMVDLTTGTETGRLEHDVKSTSAIRLENGNTILAQESNGKAIMKEVDVSGAIVREAEITGISSLRLTTYSADETFLFGSNKKAVEADWNGNIVWEFAMPDSINSKHVWKVLRMADGRTVASTGYGKSLVVISPEDEITQVIGGADQPGKDSIEPNFYAGFHVLENGHFVCTNWQAHGSGHGDEGVQILEYDNTGALVWSYKNPAMYSSVHNIIILDDLDLNLLHTETSGYISPVGDTRIRSIQIRPLYSPEKSRHRVLSPMRHFTSRSLYDLQGRLLPNSGRKVSSTRGDVYQFRIE